jgi:hypothetical protein
MREEKVFITYDDQTFSSFQEAEKHEKTVELQHALRDEFGHWDDFDGEELAKWLEDNYVLTPISKEVGAGKERVPRVRRGCNPR